MASLTLFRKRVVKTSLFPTCGLEAAIQRLGFLQADPIRCPARAQDLILRHRVKRYRAGDLEKSYPKLELEECFLYAYGFSAKDLWQLIHPKTKKAITDAEKEVLDLVAQFGPMHPTQLEARIGGRRAKNNWGGFSRSAKLALESLHQRGALRVQRREKGIRLYETAAPLSPSPLTEEQRFQEIVVIALQSMGATTRKFLLSELSHFGYLVANPRARRRCVEELVTVGRIRVDQVDAAEYLSLEEGKAVRGQADKVRILAPFDPIVRDRTRLEHLWNWTYRFEAYTPKAKRKLGYYAMPVLWREEIIGWANATVERGRLMVKIDYLSRRPDEVEYQEAVQQEIFQLTSFLNLEEGAFEASW
ncbi:MAG: crosslink repair DNA glycosylase YcaQ family protein [Verrucomicrobiota bacterium]